MVADAAVGLEIPHRLFASTHSHCLTEGFRGPADRYGTEGALTTPPLEAGLHHKVAAGERQFRLTGYSHLPRLDWGAAKASFAKPHT